MDGLGSGGRCEGELKRFKVRKHWFDILDWAALWSIALIVFIEMVRVIFKPSGLDAVILVLSIVVLLNMLK